MGAWGYELFQSDNDLEWIDYICDEAGTTLDYPDNAGEVRKELDNGLLAKTFERYLGEKDVQEYGILMLGILAMQLGARMDDKYLNIMRGIYNRDCGLYPLGKAQVKLALDAYRNDGTPWDFERTGRGTAASYIAFDNYTGTTRNLEARESGSANDEPPPGTGPPVPREINGEDGGHTHEHLHGRPRCWACTEPKEALMACVRCKKARYCGVACQKKDWKHHKPFCASENVPEKEREKGYDVMFNKAVQTAVNLTKSYIDNRKGE